MSPGSAPDRLTSVEEARRLVLEPLRTLDGETVALADAFGRVLAAPVHATDPAPPFDASEMDGYAVRAEDLAGASDANPAALVVAFEVHAGGAAPAGASIGPGEACWIATGAPVPAGADSVVPREWTRSPSPAHPERSAASTAPARSGPLGAESKGARGVAIFRAPDCPGAFIRPRGDDWAAGEQVLRAGDLLTPARVALAASCGAKELLVRRRPRIAILATGDELLEPGTPLRPGAIRESNRLLLAGLVREAGGEPHIFPLVPDDREATERALDEALGFDLALTTGGVSVGEKDLVRDALAAVGAPPRFFGVAVKPGKPLAFAVRERPGGPPAVLIALPGNPASAFVNFHLFVAPALRRLLGRADVEPLAVEARIDEDAKASPDRRTYARARLRSTRDGLAVRPLGRQASGSVRSLAEANALLVLDAGEKAAKGAPVRVEPVGWPDAAWEATS